MAEPDLNYPVQTTFARGEVSPYLFGRVDLTAYASGLRTLRNGFVRPEGAVSNRSGTVYSNNSLTKVVKTTKLLPFVFSATQSYIIEVGAGTAQVLSNGAVVTSGGVPISFVTPWAAGDVAMLRWAQSADTLSVFHPNYPTYEIKRTSANSFTCTAAVYNFGPFLPQNVDGVTFIYASAKTGLVTLTANASIFNANQVGGLIQLTQQDFSPIAPWEPSKVFTNAAGTGISPVGLYRRSNLKNYLCVAIQNTNSANPPYASGTVAPAHAQGIEADGDGSAVPNLAGSCGVQWEYQDSGYGVVLITGYISPTQVTGIVQPNYLGGPGLLPLSVVGGPTTAFGPFTFTGNGSSVTFSPLTGVTSTDPAKFIVTIGGVYQGQGTYAISGTSITFLTAPANGAAISVTQISALGQTSYWAFGAFSKDQG